MVSIDNL